MAARHGRGHIRTCGYPSLDYRVLQWVCGPSAPLRLLLALALLLSSPALPAFRTAVAKLWRTRTRICTVPPEIPNTTPSPSRHAANCVPAFELLRHTVQAKCGACALELFAAEIAVAFIFLEALAATAQRSQRSQALADNARRGQCCADVRADGTTRGTLESTLHVP